MARKKQDRPGVEWNVGVHLTGLIIFALYWVSPERVVAWLQYALAGYASLCAADSALAWYHTRKFKPLLPQAGRFALVTGASSGIGKEMAYLLAEQKYSLLLVARSQDVLERMQKEIEAVYAPAVKVEICSCDLGTAQGTQKLIEFVKSKDLTVDILINNAGASITRDFLDLKPEEIDGLMQLNTINVVTLMHALIPPMVKRGNGRVLNISSIGATLSIPTASLYGSAKCFMLNLSQALHYELRSTGVSVTCFCPGPVHTNFGKASHTDESIYLRIPGSTVSAEECARRSLKAMFNGKIYAFDTNFAQFGGFMNAAVFPPRYDLLHSACLMNPPSRMMELMKS